MKVSVVRRIDDRGFYIEDTYHYVAETLDEAKQLGYPIVKKTVPNETPPTIEEPEKLKELKQFRESLESLPSSSVRNAKLAEIDTEIQAIEENLDRLRKESTTIEIEEFIVPPMPPNLIEVEVPQDSGFWHPRWDGSKWVEGLTPEEIQAKLDAAPKFPNWEGFVGDLLGSDIDEILSTSADQRSVYRLDLTLNRRPNINIDELVLFWNRAVLALPKPLTKTQIKKVAEILEKHHIPFKLADDGTVQHHES